jgi:hypothetical protein
MPVVKEAPVADSRAQPVIKLYDLEGLALIVEWPSGVIYTNQAGGTFCMQPTAEGVLVPLGSECSVEDKLAALLADKPIRLRSEDADALDVILRTPEEPYVVTPTFFLEVDRSRLEESMEAWLYVTIIACPDEHMRTYASDGKGRLIGVTTLSGRRWHPDDQQELGSRATLYSISGFAGRRAVLTWPNSD